MTQLAWVYEDPATQHACSRKSRIQPVGGRKQSRALIEMLPEDTLLEIFDFYRLDAIEQNHERLWEWRCLAQVCRKWRYVISLSPRRLDLRILCEYGRPFENILGLWPTLPIIVRFGTRWRPEPMLGNIVVALRHPSRLCEINLNVTSSMTRQIIKAVRKPCQALESIQITVNDVKGLSILAHDTFLGGSAPRLRILKLDGISFLFPEIRRVLLSTNDLVDLHLSKIPHAAYFSPDDLVTALSTLVRLKSLTVGFHSPASSPSTSTTRRPPQCTTLPSLVSLDFHGASEYLEGIVTQINLPVLSKVAIRLFNQIFFDIPEFSRFILRPNALGPPTSVYVTRSPELASVTLCLGESSNEKLSFRTSCRLLDWQLSFVTQILTQLSPFLSKVHSLTIERNHLLLTRLEEVDSNQWLELFQPFIHVTHVFVKEELFVPGIVQALVTENMATGVLLPELNELSLAYDWSSSTASAARHFVNMRRLSGRTVRLVTVR